MIFILKLGFIYTLGVTIYAYLLKSMTDLHPLTTLTLFFVTGCTLHTIHRLGHNKKLKPWYFPHTKGHHAVAYPETKFTRPQYYNVGHIYDPYKLNMTLYIAGCLVILSIWSLYSGATYAQALGILFMMFISLAIENTIHVYIHADTSILHRFSWFKQLQAYHRRHHTYPYTYNYAVFGIHFDWLLGTLSKS